MSPLAVITIKNPSSDYKKGVRQVNEWDEWVIEQERQMDKYR